MASSAQAPGNTDTHARGATKLYGRRGAQGASKWSTRQLPGGRVRNTAGQQSDAKTATEHGGRRGMRDPKRDLKARAVGAQQQQQKKPVPAPKRLWRPSASVEPIENQQMPVEAGWKLQGGFWRC